MKKAQHKIAEAIRSVVNVDVEDSIALDIFKVGDDISVWAFIAATDIEGECVWVDINVSNEATGEEFQHASAFTLSANYEAFCQLGEQEQLDAVLPLAANIYKAAKARLDEVILSVDSELKSQVKECL